MTMAQVQPGALAGLKVVEMDQLIAGPFAAKTLGDFGADVIKIEPPDGGDPLRNWRLIQDGTSVWGQVQSRNKRSIALDLRAKEGQEIARKLIARADVLIENFRPGTLEKWACRTKSCRQKIPASSCSVSAATARRAPIETCQASERSARRWAACGTSREIALRT